MLTLENFTILLTKMGFINSDKSVFSKTFDNGDYLKVDMANRQLIYPEDRGFIVNERQTCNFSANENFVVFECIHRLFSQGYKASHIELEPKWKVGHGASGGRADILIKDNDGKSYLIVECKTAGDEFNKAWNATQTRPTQIFSYAQQERSTKFIALYTSNFIDDNLVTDYYLITLIDSQMALENKNIKSYRDATTVEEIYQVWRDTYSRDYTSFGIFENNQAYHIGEHKPILGVLKNINSNDIQGKYHEFATILRQHNVSGRENAFDKLVNLFLCKVVDEKENPQELKFYWNGKAYDDPFDFQDRLQRLYKNGMEKFLGETITYIDNSQIDEAFAVFKNKPNATKDKIKEFLRAQKFFTNSDFAFIEVHNEKLFYQNFEVLLKIARMIQDVSLTGSDENQFLGDMFEGFLDQGVKQSEGQFFTPMPIVKFIINSLPPKTNPQVIDYACGAGHFLNEYASVNQSVDKKIIGIEKEYRLSKVAKVSSFMYGSEIEIIYDDALKLSNKIQDSSFDVLIANPPYSVKGFLETLSDDDRNRFELIKTVDEKSYTTNNAIECFFIERAKQLLTKDGVAGIIVPSSILNKGSKDNIYVATREILLKYFDIVAIAEFGSGTFGKTGTNTVTLLLQRRSDIQDYAKHYQNMVNSWFDGDFVSNQEFADNDLLERYCNHIDIDFEIYQELLQNKLSDELFKHEIFAEYKVAFEKLTKTKTRRSKKYYKELTCEEQEQKEIDELIKYIKLIEQDKLYYFCLAAKNATDVIIVKSPSDSKESKRFLGYTWSTTKGKEGIQYIVNGGSQEFEDEDDRVLNNLIGIKNVNTPLYNPQNKADNQKINSIIANNFIGNNTQIPESLTQFVSKARLIDMLDFSRVEFNKLISLSPSKKIDIESKYPLEKLSKIVIAKGGNGFPEQYQNGKSGVPFFKVSDMNHKHNYPIMTIANHYVEEDVLLNEINASLFNPNTIVFPKVGQAIHTNKKRILGLRSAVDNNVMCLTVINEDVCHYKYLFEYFDVLVNLSDIALSANPPSISATNLNEVKIPLPPFDVQEQIVAECQLVNDEVSNAQHTIQTAKQSIEQIIGEIHYKTVKLSSIAILNPSKKEIANIDENTIVSFIEMASVSNDGFIENKVDRPLKELKKGSYTYFAENDIILAKITPCMENGKCAVANGLTNNIGMGSSEFHVVRVHDNAMNKFVFSFLNRKSIRIDAEKNMTGASGHRRVPISFYADLQIPLPPIEKQKEIVARIELFEEQISQAQQIIDNAKAQKQAILNKYLR